MAYHEHTADEAIRALAELFSNLPSAPKRRCRKYVLEVRDGEPVFRDVDRGPAFPRSEIELALDRIFDEVLDNDIVPEKLAKAFPGSNFEPGRY